MGWNIGQTIKEETQKHLGAAQDPIRFVQQNPVETAAAVYGATYGAPMGMSPHTQALYYGGQGALADEALGYSGVGGGGGGGYGAGGGFDQPFLPHGPPPIFGGEDYVSGQYAPDRQALDFMRDYGTTPLGQESPWMAMQREMGQRQLSRNLGDIAGQTQSAYQQQAGNIAAAGGIDPATRARLAQTTGRTGMEAAQTARGDYQDFIGKAGVTDLEQRLGMTRGVAGLEPAYASQGLEADKFRHLTEFDRWQAMHDASADQYLAQQMSRQGYGGGGGGGGYGGGGVSGYGEGGAWYGGGGFGSDWNLDKWGGDIASYSKWASGIG